MNQVQHARVMQILAEAMDLPLERRGLFLDATCAGDPELRRDLEDLLDCAEPAAHTFDAASDELARADPDQIGPYTVLEPIGEGGMAIVYRAQQHHPVRRIVALKIIKLGMDTRQFVARFEAERQALAMMDHPNLARVFDAGSTATGRPYFVMEYVPGRPILEYCDEHNLDVRRRLNLFIHVCEAVEHAHRKGIIHRDLKDTNVLVTEIDGKPVPKVIDFGVAKAIQQPLTDRTLYTEHGQLIGTPEYMSPEQAERGPGAPGDIDTRSDVYSLGVLLYELIAGVQPIPSDVLRGAGLEQVQRIIRETEPQRPSTRLSTLGGADGTRIAQRRSTALPTLIRNLRSELEWIPLKAMRKDREQRYRSAAELADDIRNYLDGRPLIAGPESAWYRARKLVHRHKTGVAASAAIVLLLVGGIVATTLQAVRATRAERRAVSQQQRADREAAIARKQASIARSVNALMTDMIGKANRAQQKGDPNVTVRAVMDAATADLSARSGQYEPEVEASLRGAIGQTYGALGIYDAGERLLRECLELRIGILGDEDLEVVATESALAEILDYKGNHAEAESLYRNALEARRRILGEDHRETLVSMSALARVLLKRGRLAEAESLCHEALDRCRRTLGDEHSETVSYTNNLAVVLIKRNKLAEAEPLSRAVLDYARATYGDDHPNTIDSIHNLAFLLHRQGKLTEAEPLYRQASEQSRRIVGDDHPETLAILCNFGCVLSDQGRLADAEPLFAELYRRVPLAEYDRALAAQHVSYYGPCLVRLGRYQQAEQPLREAYDRLISAGLENHARTRSITAALAEVYDHTNRPDEAAKWRAKLKALQAATQPATNPG